MSLDAKSLEKLKGVHPDLVKVILRGYELSPIKFIVTEGLRSVERQKQLVAKGASKTMESRHITGHAVDIVPYIDSDKDGNIYEDARYDWPLYYKVAPAIKLAATQLGIPVEWGGDWRTFKDGPHFQLPWKQYP